MNKEAGRGGVCHSILILTYPPPPPPNDSTLMGFSLIPTKITNESNVPPPPPSSYQFGSHQSKSKLNQDNVI